MKCPLVCEVGGDFKQPVWKLIKSTLTMKLIARGKKNRKTKRLDCEFSFEILDLPMARWFTIRWFQAHLWPTCSRTLSPLPPPKVKRKLFHRLYFTLAGGGCSYTLASWSTSEKTSIQKQLADYRAAKFLLNRKSKLKE